MTHSYFTLLKNSFVIFIFLITASVVSAQQYTLTDTDVVVDSSGTITSISYNTTTNTNIVIPDRLDNQIVKRIGDRVFKNIGLTAVTLPNTLQRLGYGAFQDNSLSSISIPARVTYIDSYAFDGNSSLASFNLPSPGALYTYNWVDDSSTPNSFTNGQSVSNFTKAYNAQPTFNGVRVSGEVRGADAVTLTVTGAVSQTLTLNRNSNYEIEVAKGSSLTINASKSGITFLPSANYTLTNLQTNLYRQDFYIKYTLTDSDVVVTNNSITSISYDLKNKDIVLPSTLDGQTVKEIALGVFSGKDIKTIDLPTTLEEIGLATFMYNELLEVNLPNSITNISENAFRHNKITSFTLPSRSSSNPLYEYKWEDNSNNYHLGGAVVTDVATQYYQRLVFIGARIEGQTIGEDASLAYSINGIAQTPLSVKSHTTFKIEVAKGDDVVITPSNSTCTFTPSNYTYTGITASKSDQNFTAQHSIVYTDKFNVTNTNKTKVSYGAFVQLHDLSKTGYDFYGWVTSPNSLRKDRVGYSEGETINLTAVWTPIDYTINYYYGKDNNNKDITNVVNTNVFRYTIEDQITLANPTRDQYAFDGWFKDPAYTQAFNGTIATGTTGNLSLYVKWRHTGQTTQYTITYKDTKGADNPNPTTYESNTEGFKLERLEKDGFYFNGWKNGPGENVLWYTEIWSTVGDITLYADWSVVTSINNQNEVDNEILIFPNPFLDEITIDLTHYSKEVTIRVTSIDNKLIKNIKAFGTANILIDGPAGIYIVSVLSEGKIKSYKVSKR
ncbi:leucine-rich repeat protein [Flammeovirga kamogawensis]|uniref:Leucine-rich repeat protein n=1 Tax=Flammeovirga kamogawensis TaxID=373891 RepID=A0ABX8GYE5_9BACT|nr:leucine-rich repeat protein [Flammeovirga kamogawensis]MBB6459022.1 putative repeat protein (TIGR02543 family) [Flammeovirga kamogawensis]QWG08595.1 leucine-rich repeat protein [Flammeovirga kamogawensis]TRX66887.1 leucine-rich repeat protein [Flammeovirga kamogawensis]